MAEERCPKLAREIERMEGREVTVDLPCARRSGHKGPCSADYITAADFRASYRREEILSADEAAQNVIAAGGF